MGIRFSQDNGRPWVREDFETGIKFFINGGETRRQSAIVWHVRSGTLWTGRE